MMKINRKIKIEMCMFNMQNVLTVSKWLYQWKYGVLSDIIILEQNKKWKEKESFSK